MNKPEKQTYKCPDCDGTGEVPEQSPFSRQEILSMNMQSCGNCGGSGRIT